MSVVIPGETFDEKRIEVDFQNVFNRLSQMEWHSMIDSHRYAYKQGYEAGKAAQKRQTDSPESSQ